MSKLKEQMKADLQLRGFKPRTQKTYLREVSNLARYFDKSPEELGKEEVKKYLLHLIEDKKLLCVSARIAAGWENPRKDYEAPSYRLILEHRQRQLHDEDKSCGIQPAYIRVIYRRLSLLS